MTESTQTEVKKKKVGPDPLYRFAEHISFNDECGQYKYCLEEDVFYIYKDGVWTHIYETEMLHAIAKAVPEFNKYPLNMRKQVIENLKTFSFCHLDIFNKLELLNMPNGMLSPYKGLLLDHDPVYLSTLRLPYIYDEDAKCELWLAKLKEILEEDQQKINVLQEFFGYCLTRDTNQHKSLLLLGESRSGKSTILQTLRNVIGIRNCSSVPLKFISNPQYTPMLISKLVNIDTDVSAKAQEFEAEFKTITSGEPVACNQKFIAAFEFVPYCKIVMAANIFPRITDHSSAFYKRLILIPCNRVFSEEEQDRDLSKKLALELPSILNWAIEGLKRLNERGRFENNEFMSDAIEELREESNPVDVFLKENITVDINGDHQIEKGELYNKYSQWCRDNGNAPMSAIKFGQIFYNKYSKYTPRKAQCFSTGKRVWKNVKYLLPTQGQEITWQDNQ